MIGDFGCDLGWFWFNLAFKGFGLIFILFADVCFVGYLPYCGLFDLCGMFWVFDLFW